jgi:hypothetical protein
MVGAWPVMLRWLEFLEVVPFLTGQALISLGNCTKAPKMTRLDSCDNKLEGTLSLSHPCYYFPSNFAKSLF